MPTAMSASTPSIWASLSFICDPPLGPDLPLPESWVFPAFARHNLANARGPKQTVPVPDTVRQRPAVAAAT